jgi:glutathione S-transferase
MWQRVALTLGWSRIVPLMIKGMDLGIAQGLQSRVVLEAELDWLDGLLADGRPYLHGDQWSRADLTAAALLGPLATPKEHHLTEKIFVPNDVHIAMKEWDKRPALQFVGRMYSTHRL